MKVAIMQPYLFPYLGYFQLIHSSNVFVFYDDVNFKNKSWINRNKLLVDGKGEYFQIELSKKSQNKLIKETEILSNTKSFNKLRNILKHQYKSAPFFDSTYALVNEIINRPFKSISELAISSVTEIFDYLELSKDFKVSSADFPETRGLGRIERLVEITKLNNSLDYINMIGGSEIYTKEKFKSKGVNLHFLETNLPEYKQFNFPPISGLSIIDTLMFNDRDKVKEMTEAFNLK
ncbi:WbqC family protein [Flavobacteriaceae bacterium]|nr:WbqC family protein [Flavobacteriaceae bacterium]